MRTLIVRSWNSALRFCAFAIVGGLLHSEAIAADAALGDEFHREFDAVLKAHVIDGQVNYAGIATDDRFPAYLEALAEARVASSVPTNQQLAFWINAYNALAIQGILNGHSPSSLLGRLKYFKRDKYNVGDMTITLYDLERNVIIPLGDNRIHFAIVCASASCPPLRSEAYVPSRIGAQLAEQTDIFINDTSKNRFDLDTGKARLSKIFDWFGDDFAAEAGSVQRYVARHIRNTAAQSAFSSEQLKVRYLKYDWRLNGSPPGK